MLVDQIFFLYLSLIYILVIICYMELVLTETHYFDTRTKRTILEIVLHQLYKTFDPCSCFDILTFNVALRIRR